LGKLVTSYFFENKSCEQLGWETSGEEGEGHKHLVHGVVAGVCEKEERLESFVEKEVETLVSFLHERSMQTRAPFSLLSRAKVRVFMSPQNRGDALF
jgi:hypothetical protein